MPKLTVIGDDSGLSLTGDDSDLSHLHQLNERARLLNPPMPESITTHSGLSRVTNRLRASRHRKAITERMADFNKSLDWQTILKEIPIEKRDEVRQTLFEHFVFTDNDFPLLHSNHPVVISDSVLRFKANAVVKQLVDAGQINIDKLADDYEEGKFSLADYMQFYRLLGSSLLGYLETFQDDWDRLQGREPGSVLAQKDCQENLNAVIESEFVSCYNCQNIYHGPFDFDIETQEIRSKCGYTFTLEPETETAVCICGTSSLLPSSAGYELNQLTDISFLQSMKNYWNPQLKET